MKTGTCTPGARTPAAEEPWRCPRPGEGLDASPACMRREGAAGPAQGSPTFQRLGPGNREGPRPGSAERKGARNGPPGRGARRGLGAQPYVEGGLCLHGAGERGKPVRPAFWVPTCPLPLAQPIGDHQEPPGLRRLTPTQGLTSRPPTLEPIPKEEPVVQRPLHSGLPLPHASAPAPGAPAGLMPGSGPQSHPLLREPLWEVPTSHAPPESPPCRAPLHSAWGTLPRGLSPPARQRPPGRASFPSPEAPSLTQEALRGAQTHCSEAPTWPRGCGDGGLPPWPPLTRRPLFYLLLC